MRYKSTMLIFIVIGSLFLIASLILGLIVPRNLRADATRIEQLQPQSVASLATQPPDSDVVIEGRINPANRVLQHGFVAYIAERYSGTDSNDNEQWLTIEEASPRLLIDLPDGLVQLTNENYPISGNLGKWQEPGMLTYSTMRGTGTKRYRGLPQAAEVMVLGKLRAAAPGTEADASIDAEMVYAGNRAGYLSSTRDVAFWLGWAGVALAIVGLLIIGVPLYAQRKMG